MGVIKEFATTALSTGSIKRYESILNQLQKSIVPPNVQSFFPPQRHRVASILLQREVVHSF